MPRSDDVSPSGVRATARGGAGEWRLRQYQHHRGAGREKERRQDVTAMETLRADIERELADRYAIERELGRGGMATVFSAQDLKHDRPVALKVLHPDLSMAIGAERFAREIKLVARLQHPHILQLYD